MLSLRTFTFSEESDHMKYIQGSTEVALRMLGGAQDAALQHGPCDCWSEVLRSEVVDFSANSKGRSAQIRWREESIFSDWVRLSFFSHLFWLILKASPPEDPFRIRQSWNGRNVRDSLHVCRGSAGSLHSSTWQSTRMLTASALIRRGDEDVVSPTDKPSNFVRLV